MQRQSLGRVERSRRAFLTEREGDGSHDHLHLGARAAPDAGQRENTETVAKQKQPPSAFSLDTMRGARAR